MKKANIRPRLMTAIQAGVLGAVLVVGASACNLNTNQAGTESTADVCADLGELLPHQVADVVASPYVLDMYLPSEVKANKPVTDALKAYLQLSQTLHTEADQAADPELAAALISTANSVDADGAKIKTIDDVRAIPSTIDLTSVDQFCPQLDGQVYR
jgi:hypothetical protein